MWLWIWVAVIVLSLGIELLTCQLVSIWFTVGGLFALILQVCGVQPLIQILVFVAISLILVLSLRKLGLKVLLKKSEGKTNTETIMGTVHTLLSGITQEESGSVKINGVVWSAVSNQDIPEGSKVKIVSIKGNKLSVEKVNEEAKNKNEGVINE